MSAPACEEGTATEIGTRFCPSLPPSRPRPRGRRGEEEAGDLEREREPGRSRGLRLRLRLRLRPPPRPPRRPKGESLGRRTRISQVSKRLRNSLDKGGGQKGEMA